MTATEILTLLFICTFHSRMAGSSARLQSVMISIAEKNRLTSLLSFRLHVPLDAPQSVLMGWPDCVSMHYWHGLGWIYRTYVGNAHAEDKRGYASHTDDGPERQLDATVRC
jgi:hypothetical protein